jgi:hypothetical protein
MKGTSTAGKYSRGNNLLEINPTAIMETKIMTIVTGRFIAKRAGAIGQAVSVAARVS